MAVLALAPAGMFFSHIVSYRLLRGMGRRPTAHTSAFAGIAVWLTITLAAVARLVWPAVAGNPLEAVCIFAYALAVYAALAVLYVDVVNIAETSLHMHLLLEIAWSRRPSLRDLIFRYSPERMVAERLDRLVAMGQVRMVDGRYVVGDRSALRLATAIDVWRRVLGLPTSPGEPTAR